MLAAANETSADHIAKVLHDEYVRAGRAANPQTPTELLHRFATDDDPLVRACAASNPRLVPELYVLAWVDDRAVLSTQAPPDASKIAERALRVSADASREAREA